MLASSREGEESQWLQALNTMDEVPDCHWLLVPRHPQRFDAVANLLRGAGLSFARRSQHSAVADWVAVPSEVWLGDSLGEMALYYSLADLALLGGSFAPLGGQNLIEAAACGCTVVMGPHTFNFSEVAERAVAAGAAVRADAHGPVGSRDVKFWRRPSPVAWTASSEGQAVPGTNPSRSLQVPVPPDSG
jgi:3-deoxy-D-manno-octulosonic-acid transferase